jgi:hypothetical protein
MQDKGSKCQSIPSPKQYLTTAAYMWATVLTTNPSVDFCSVQIYLDSIHTHTERAQQMKY